MADTAPAKPTITALERGTLRSPDQGPTPRTAIFDSSSLDTPRGVAPQPQDGTTPLANQPSTDTPEPAATGTTDSAPTLTALARFEFEPGRGNEGTKILMVEWEDTDPSRTTTAGGSWTVEWNGKQAVMSGTGNSTSATAASMSAKEDGEEEASSEDTRRFYFLLPPGATIPPVVTLAYTPPAHPTTPIPPHLLEDSAIPSSSPLPPPLPPPEPKVMTLNPLPAIFPASLGVTARSAGKKGVLHTLWAKKRLRSLAKEIREEEQYNLEGIALEMARMERKWILNNFGVSDGLGDGAAAASASAAETGNQKHAREPLPLLSSPRSPTSPRLTEKLKGLRLGTSEKDLGGRKDGISYFRLETNPLSPETPDIAVSSFNSFRNTPVSSTPLSASVPTSQLHHQNHQPPIPIKGIPPPSEILRAQEAASASASDSTSAATPLRQQNQQSRPQQHHQQQQMYPPHPTTTTTSSSADELFAVALSPRSPDEARSPFSFSGGGERVALK